VWVIAPDDFLAWIHSFTEAEAKSSTASRDVTPERMPRPQLSTGVTSRFHSLVPVTGGFECNGLFSPTMNCPTPAL